MIEGILLIFVICLVIGIWKVKESFPLKYQRRRELQAEFAAFAAANRVIQINQSRIDQFWQSTSDAWHYFTNSDVHHLRQMLYDNAQTLISIDKELEFCRSDSALYSELISKKKSILTWFSDTLDHMDPIFIPETKHHPNYKDIGHECLRKLNRVLRA